MLYGNINYFWCAFNNKIVAKALFGSLDSSPLAFLAAKS